MQPQFTKHIGLDVHARTITAAVAETRRDREVRYLGEFANHPDAIGKLIGQLTQASGDSLQFWYEAGPCGYGLYRRLQSLGHPCTVVAPSLVPRKAGDRVKTDRRDALSLARLGRAGELTGVWVPDEAHEAMRDLTRCREDAKLAQRQARQQLNSFLLRHDRFYDQGKKWTQRHRDWLMRQQFTQSLQEQVYQDYLEQVQRAGERLADLDQRIRKAAPHWSMWPVVQGWMAMRGIDWVAATTLAAELDDVSRFASPRQLMSFVGLVPSERSSGMSTRRAGITKSGNTHARRMLVEVAWSYRFAARKTRIIQDRAREAPPSVQQLAWQAQRRLCGRYRHLVNQGKLTVQTTTAVARELCGFLWAIAREIQRLESAGPAGEPSTRL